MKADPQVLLMLIKIIVLEINSTLKGIRKHHNDFLGDLWGPGEQLL